MKKNIMILAAMACIATFAFYSCSKDKNEQNTTLHVRLTDAPTAFDEVNVDIREVKVKFSDDTTNAGWVTLTTFPGVYNLLDYQNGVDTLLATGAFPTQTIKEIRFVLGPNNTIKDAGIVYPLTIPSGSESGLKIKISRTLQATLETIIIDFDAALSVKKEGTGDYKLRPVLKIR
ncbi:MAG TPA: DUF4382 domain-containing protein [Ferruginibacter sp.]|nr:DUF4382 domain-containing protein [Chitinophagaceae bacterium]MBK9530466.1 DUF4382 domain-containing protein [Chitinophagaceae bacterium]HQW92430.1 DUF4382 domain-containing protein [Ferruginibacter sp.]